MFTTVSQTRCPLKYYDPNGEFVFAAIAEAGIIASICVAFAPAAVAAVTVWAGYELYQYAAQHDFFTDLHQIVTQDFGPSQLSKRKPYEPPEA